MDWIGETIYKKIPKTAKTAKVKFPNANKENHKQKTIFIPNPCSQYFKKIAQPVDCSLQFLFRRAQNNYFNFISKTMKMCLKRRTPIQFNSFELKKNA